MQELFNNGKLSIIQYKHNETIGIVDLIELNENTIPITLLNIQHKYPNVKMLIYETETNEYIYKFKNNHWILLGTL
ncbi:MAG: hypothetical protein II625_02245 [Bacilli bacterium]|nr:hypothetical protein [Bacilli bacterium]